MKKIFPALFAFIVCIVMTGCSAISASPFSTPMATVERFTEAVSDLDMEAALECCDSSTQTIANSAFGLADGLLSGLGVEINSYDLMALVLPSLEGINSAMTGEEWSLSVEASDLQEETNGESAVVSGIWTISMTTGGHEQVQDGEIQFNLIKEGDEWKIDLSQEMLKALT